MPMTSAVFREEIGSSSVAGLKVGAIPIRLNDRDSYMPWGGTRMSKVLCIYL